MQRRIIPKAVYIGLATFSVLYLGFIILGNLVMPGKLSSLLLLQIALLVFSGYVAGRLSIKSGWLNGIMVGIAAPVVIAVGLSIYTMQPSMPSMIFSALGMFWLIQSIVCCAIGGFLWDLQSKVQSSGP